MPREVPQVTRNTLRGPNIEQIARDAVDDWALVARDLVPDPSDDEPLPAYTGHDRDAL